MKILLDRQSSEPLYLQIHDRFKHLIQTGILQADQQLPSIRALAETIRVNKLTVIEAYGRLEADGLIRARQGSGYFVSSALVPPAPSLQSNFAPAQSVVMSEQQSPEFYDVYTRSLQARLQPDVIDFGIGYPQPPNDIERVSKRAMTHIAKTLCNYDFPQGQETLRRQIAHMLIQLGLEVSADNLIITTGSQQGLCLTIQQYVQPGDWVVVESPTYFGVLTLLQQIGAKVIGIPMTAEGMNLELLEQYLGSHRPNLIYTVSTLHNPTGITTSQAHRQQLLALAEQYQCPILEDNAYEGLNFEPVPPPIKALDKNGWVTYLGTFSKTLIPGLRVGYMVTNSTNHQALLDRKLVHDLHSSMVSQGIVSEYLASGHYRRHLNQLRTNHLQCRNEMLQAMERYFPEEVTWTVPKGGVFLWVQLPNQSPVQEICHQASLKKVFVASGCTFFPGQQGYPALRLSFRHSPEDCDRGISILGSLLKRHLQPAIPFGSVERIATKFAACAIKPILHRAGHRE